MSDSTEPKPRPPRSFARQLASSGLWAIVGRFAAIASVLLNYRLVCEYLPAEEVSIYVVATGIATLASLVCASGLGSVLLRRMSHVRKVEAADSFDVIESSEPLPPKFALLFQIIVMAAIVWIALSVSLVGFLESNPMFFGRAISPLAMTIVFWTGARCLLTLLAEAARALKRFSLTAMIGGQQEGPAVNLSITAVLLWMNNGIDSAGKVVSVHLFITTAVSFISLVLIARVCWQLDGKIAFRFPYRTWDIIRESSKVLVSQLATRGINDVETLLIGKYCDTQMINTWGAIRRLMTAVSAPLQLINAAVPGFVAELHSQNDYKRLERLLRGTCTLATPPAIIAFMLIAAFAPWLLSQFDSTFTIGASSLTLLAAANVFFVAAGSAGLTLRMTDNQGAATLTTLIIGAIYLAAAPWVIQHHQIWGAAVLATLVIVFRNAIATWLVKTRLNIWCTPEWDPRKVVPIVAMIRNRRKRKTLSSKGSS